ncbi:MAG: transglycosylase SLT domain-containing protein [Bacteroidales bacterium]|nr:transglycosylase SLT domain-containing protein [Bacteroidales bacterium]
MAKKRSKSGKNSGIIRFVQIITFLWVFSGILTVLVTALGTLKGFKFPFSLRMISYGLALCLLIFLIVVISNHLLPGIRKSIKGSLSKTVYRQVVYVASILAAMILLLFVNETYLRFFSTPVYQDTEYFISKIRGKLNNSDFSRNELRSSQHEYDEAEVPSSDQSHIYSTEGRFYRTIRWQKEISAAEKKYNIPPCLIAGLIMQESMGNPLQVNDQNDGGAGLMQFQPGTAQQYGLKTFGTSKTTGRDLEHGQILLDMMAIENFDYNNICRKDERFDIDKSIDAGARFLHELYERHGTWDKAISAYNRGTPALIPANTVHVRLVKNFQRYYCQNKPG